MYSVISASFGKTLHIVSLTYIEISFHCKLEKQGFLIKGAQRETRLLFWSVIL